MKLEETDGDEALKDGVVEDVSSVGEVSPTGGADDVREDEAGSEGEGGDGEWAEEEPSGVKVQDVEERGGEHDRATVALELRQVVVDECADEEEAELSGELDGERLVGGKENAVKNREEDAGDENGVAMEAAAYPDEDGNGAVEGHFDLDGPESAVHGGVAGVGLEDAGDAGVEEVQEGEVTDEKFSDLKVPGGEGDGEAEQSGEPIAGEDAEGAIGEVLT